MSDSYDAQLKTLEELAKKIQADCRARDVEIGQLAVVGERLGVMLTRTQEVCAEAYQAVGQLAHMAGVWNAEETVKLMDNLVAASQGDPIPHETVLPFAPIRVLGDLQETLYNLRETCTETWEVVDYLAEKAGLRNTLPVIKALGNLAAASNCDRPPHDDVLPFAPERVPCGECHLPAGERCDICGAVDRNGAAG